jgi:predicted phosphodiesterase
MIRDMAELDIQHAHALKGMWFLGDVHGEFKHIAQCLLDAPEKPRWLIFLGDIDIDHKSFRELCIEPLKRSFPSIQVAFIHGNHDADTYEHWDMLHDCGDAVAIHGKVIEIEGVRIAGLGGNFLGRIWSPPANPTFLNKQKAMNRGAFQWRDGQRPNPSLHAAIYPDDVELLAKQHADILITHEAPSCHPYGFAAIDDLARRMRVVRSFHGHQHDDRSDEYALVRDKLGFDAKAVDYCGIKNGLGQVIHAGPKGW